MLYCCRIPWMAYVHRGFSPDSKAETIEIKPGDYLATLGHELVKSNLKNRDFYKMKFMWNNFVGWTICSAKKNPEKYWLNLCSNYGHYFYPAKQNQ